MKEVLLFNLILHTPSSSVRCREIISTLFPGMCSNHDQRRNNFHFFPLRSSLSRFTSPTLVLIVSPSEDKSTPPHPALVSSYTYFAHGHDTGYCGISFIANPSIPKHYKAIAIRCTQYQYQYQCQPLQSWYPATSRAMR